MKQLNVKWIRPLIHTIIAMLAIATLSLGAPALALAAPANQPAAADYTCSWYIIKRGDTLTKIGIKFGVTVKTLMAVNGLRSTRIYAGQRLCIPVYTPQPASGPWYGEYWNNTAQSGTPALVRNDAAVNFNWGYGTPNSARIFADNFSARWTRTLNFAGGTWRFSLSADDGIRLWLDANVVLDRYSYVGGQTNQVDVVIPAGVHTLRVDYVEQSGLASARVTYYRLSGAPQPCPGCPPPQQNGPWHSEYFNNTVLGGTPVYVKDYNGLSFDWGGNAPVPGVPSDNWSARFVQYRTLSAGTYRFVARSDDGVRIWVDDRPVINQWVQQSARTVTGDITLGAGTHSIRVEYFDLGGVASLQVYWDFLGNANP
jgi:LysM repeat protein